MVSNWKSVFKSCLSTVAVVCILQAGSEAVFSYVASYLPAAAPLSGVNLNSWEMSIYGQNDRAGPSPVLTSSLPVYSVMMICHWSHFNYQCVCCQECNWWNININKSNGLLRVTLVQVLKCWQSMILKLSNFKHIQLEWSFQF